MEILLNLLGYILIWACVDYKRKPDSQINTFSLDLLIQLVLILSGVFLIHYNW